MPRLTACLKASMYIGNIVSKNIARNAVEVRVMRLKMDEYLTMYFNEAETYWADDPRNELQTGDIVRIRQLPQAKNDLVEYEVREVVHKFGHMVDPLTGRRCRGPVYIDEENRKFGKLLPENEKT